MGRSLVAHPFTDVFRGSVARKAGLVSDGQLRGPAFRRLFQDVYVPAEIPVTHALRCRGAALIAPPEAVLTGRSAASVHGVELAKPYDPVEFVVPERARFGPIQGIRVRRTEVREQESHPWHGVRLATPLRTALDLLFRHSPRTRGWVRRLRTCVPDLDALLGSGLVQQKQVAHELRKRRNWGVTLGRRAVAMADPRAESLPESELRVVLVIAGFTPKTQHKVRQGGRELGRLDLALDQEKVAIEYDGKWHLKPEEVLRDHRRRTRIRAAGWRFVIVDAEMLAGDHETILAAIRKVRLRT